MSRFSRGPLLSKMTAGRGGGNVDVDPVLAAILGVVIIGGGGLAAYGASQDTEPQPTPAPAAQPADPVVERALAIVSRIDGTTSGAEGEGVSAAERTRMERRAARASAKGASVDPFGAIKSGAAAVSGVTASATPNASATASSTGSTPSAAERARRVAAAAAASNAAVGGATGGPTSTTRQSGSSSASTAKSTRSTSSSRRASTSARPTQVSLRIATQGKRRSKSRARIGATGVLVPTANSPVARVIAASKDGRRVTLRLKVGAYLSGKQSTGTKCVLRTTTGGGECRLVSVVTGRTAVIRDEDTLRGNRGTLTAVRVLSVWGGGKRLAGK